MHINFTICTHTKTRLEKAGFKTFCFSAVLLYKRIHSVRSNIIQTPHCDAILFKLQKIGRTERKMFAVCCRGSKYNITLLKLIVLSWKFRSPREIKITDLFDFVLDFRINFLFKKNCILRELLRNDKFLIIEKSFAMNYRKQNNENRKVLGTLGVVYYYVTQ